jgi:hypothetical protein
MNKELLDFIEKLYGYDEFKGLYYSLTINYKDVITDYRPEIFDFDSIFKIKNLISEYNVESFNFTLYDNFPIERNKKDYNFEYDRYWYSLRYTFHGQNNINLQLNFLSQGLSINQLPEKLKLNENSVLKLIEIGNFYKKTSKEMYKLLW